MQSRGDSNLGGHYLGVATIRGELGDRVGRCHVALPKIPYRIGKYCGKKVKYSYIFLIISLLSIFPDFLTFVGLQKSLNFLIL
jgi:hypothetical protein